MKKMKKLTAILLMLTLCLALAACGSKQETTSNGGTTTDGGTTVPPPTAVDRPDVLVPGDVIEAPEGDNIRFADRIVINAEDGITVIDPKAPGAVSAILCQIYRIVFDNLVYRTAEGTYEPQLATSWETDDMHTWIFHLRDDVYFHNGDHFTAQDVVNTFSVGSDSSAVGSQANITWRNVESVTATGEYTVEIVTKMVNGEFLYQLSIPGGGMLNTAARDADPIEGPWVGTGPFCVSDFMSGNYTELTRNDNYWGPAPITRVLHIQWVPEVASRTVMQLNGDADVNLAISANDLDMFAENPDHIVYAYASNATHCIFFNMNHPITNDLNFRLAVAHAVDREEIAIASGGNWNKPTQDGAWWGDSTQYRNTSLQQRAYNLDLAREYLAASSYNGEEIEILTGPDTLTVASQVLQEQLSKIGINTKLFSTDIGTLVSRAQNGNTSMEICFFVGAFLQNPSSARSVYYTGLGGNRASYSNAEVDELLDLALGVPLEEQEALYMRAQELVYEDIPGLSLFERLQAIVTNKNVGGIIVNSDMHHDWRGVFMIVDD